MSRSPRSFGARSRAISMCARRCPASVSAGGDAIDAAAAAPTADVGGSARASGNGNEAGVGGVTGCTP